MQRQFQRLSFPERAHPLVQQFYLLLNVERVTISEIGRQAGWSTRTINGWRTDSNPSLSAFHDCVQALGYDLVIVPKGEDHTALPRLPIRGQGGDEALEPFAIGNALGLTPGDEALHVIHMKAHREVVKLKRRAASAFRGLPKRLTKREPCLV